MPGAVKGGTVFQLVEAGELDRYGLRNALHRVRDNRVDPKLELLCQSVYNVFLGQLRRGESLETFTYNWDVHPGLRVKRDKDKKPVPDKRYLKILKVIRPQEWRVMKKHLHPEAFAQQKRVPEEDRLFPFQQPHLNGAKALHKQRVLDGLLQLKRETLRILRLPMDHELLALVDEETREREQAQLVKDKLLAAEQEEAEREMSRLMSVAKSRRAEGWDVDDVLQQMLAVSAKLKQG